MLVVRPYDVQLPSLPLPPCERMSRTVRREVRHAPGCANTLHAISHGQCCSRAEAPLPTDSDHHARGCRSCARLRLGRPPL